MKKFVLLVLSFILPMILVYGCAATPLPLLPTAAPEPTSNPQTAHPPIPVFVLPFYDSEGLLIRVGNYSQQLGTSDIQELTALAEEMAEQKSQLTPEQMFVLAIRFYDLGNKDDSVYWFYEAQFRAKLFYKTLDADHFAGLSAHSDGLLASYDAFTELAGKYINGYAGCDVENWMKIAGAVKDSNPTPPELDKLFPDAELVERSRWQGINDEVAAGLGALIEQLSTSKDAIRQQRVADNVDALYCN